MAFKERSSGDQSYSQDAILVTSAPSLSPTPRTKVFASYFQLRKVSG